MQTASTSFHSSLAVSITSSSSPSLPLSSIPSKQKRRLTGRGVSVLRCASTTLSQPRIGPARGGDVSVWGEGGRGRRRTLVVRRTTTVQTSRLLIIRQRKGLMRPSVRQERGLDLHMILISLSISSQEEKEGIGKKEGRDKRRSDHKPTASSSSGRTRRNRSGQEGGRALGLRGFACRRGWSGRCFSRFGGVESRAMRRTAVCATDREEAAKGRTSSREGRR